MDHKQEESLPEGLADGNIDAFRKKEFLYRFAIDAWCQRPSLHARTFPTLILPLSPEEGAPPRKESVIGMFIVSL
jgi:hypothetical protein